MNHRYDEDNYSRREPDWNRDRQREGRENESSFYPGSHGFDETREGRGEGQREPYSTSGSGGSSYGASGYGQDRGEGQGGYQQGRDEQRSYQSRDYGRDYGRGESGGRSDWRDEDRGFRGSRHGESQYGQGQFGRGQYGQGQSGQGEYDQRRNWGGRSPTSRSSQGWEDWDRGSPYGDRSRGEDWQYGNRGTQGSGGRGSDYYYGGSRHGGGRYVDEDYGAAQRYGVGYTGSPSFGRSRSFGDEPRYYGFGEERWRSQPGSTGWMRESEQGSRFFGGEQRGERGRPGLDAAALRQRAERLSALRRASV